MCFKIFGLYPAQQTEYSVLLNATNDDSLHFRRLLLGVKFIYDLFHKKIKCRQTMDLLNFSDRRVSSRKPLIFANNIPRTNILIKSPLYVMCQNVNAICNTIDIHVVHFESILAEFRIYFNEHMRIYS